MPHHLTKIAKDIENKQGSCLPWLDKFCLAIFEEMLEQTEIMNLANRLQEQSFPTRGGSRNLGKGGIAPKQTLKA